MLAYSLDANCPWEVTNDIGDIHVADCQDVCGYTEGAIELVTRAERGELPPNVTMQALIGDPFPKVIRALVCSKSKALGSSSMNTHLRRS